MEKNEDTLHYLYSLIDQGYLRKKFIIPSLKEARKMVADFNLIECLDIERSQKDKDVLEGFLALRLLRLQNY